MNLVSIAKDLWGVETLLPFPGGVWLPARCTVVRLVTGKLVLISPLRLDDATAESLRALGPVEALVSPSLYHHLYLGSAKERFPEARVLGPEGLSKKQPRLDLDAELAAQTPAFWPGDLEQHFTAGVSRINEIAFYHVRSRALIVCDLLFNVRQPANLATRMALGMMGTNGPVRVSRLLRHYYAQDKAALRASLNEILQWDIERVVMAHGDVLEHDARRELERAWSTI